MEGEYAGEELRIEVRAFLFRRSEDSEAGSPFWLRSYWKRRWNGLLRVPSWMTWPSRWTRPPPRSAPQSWKSNQSPYPRRHILCVDLRHPSRRRSSRRSPGTARRRRAQARLRRCRRSRGRTCLGKRTRARPLNPDEKKPLAVYYRATLKNYNGSPLLLGPGFFYTLLPLPPPGITSYI
jgi:hypothetical protein